MIKGTRKMAVPQMFSLCLFTVTFVLILEVESFLLDNSKVDCPHPATNCLQETYNKVFENLGCLGCQSGCKPGYIMIANPKYFVTGSNTTGNYTFHGLNIPRSKNISEPQWLCVQGNTCPFGYFHTKIGQADSCSYCGDGCWTCDGYENCKDCLLGFWITHATISPSVNISTCTSSGITCPEPKEGWHCKHQVYARATVGCSGCVLCEDGYLPTSNSAYRRAQGNVTGTYDYMGLHISGSIEIFEPRYICRKGHTCSMGYHNVTRNGILLCEDDSVVVG